jgi:hypothetical protein
MASKRSAIETAPALHLLYQIGGSGNEDRRTNETTGADTQIAAFKAGIGFKKKKRGGVGVSH